jgi:hypothetical protein
LRTGKLTRASKPHGGVGVPVSKKLSLEDRLRALANAGELSYLSIVPTAGKGGGGVVYSAHWSSASKFGNGMGRDPDPVIAIHKALDDDRLASLIKKLKIDTTQLPTVVPEPPTPVPAAEEDDSWLR